MPTQKKKSPFAFGASASPGSVDMPRSNTSPGSGLFGFDIPVGAQGLAPQAQAPASPWASIAPLFAQESTPFDFQGLFSAMRNDPVADANKAYRPGADSAANPFSNGFFNNSAAQLSPEAQMATQGGSAQNQWAQLGQVPGVDPAKLQALMGQMAPIPTPGVPQAMTSDPFFNRAQAQPGGVSPADQMNILRLLYGI